MSTPAVLGRLQRVATTPRCVGLTLDGGDQDITTGQKGYVACTFTGKVIKWTLLADGVGSIVIDVWKTSFDGAPPTVSNSITGGHKPTLSSQQKAKSSDLAGWTTAVTAGDVFGFNVDSVSGVKRATLAVCVVPL